MCSARESEAALHRQVDGFGEHLWSAVSASPSRTRSLPGATVEALFFDNFLGQLQGGSRKCRRERRRLRRKSAWPLVLLSIFEDVRQQLFAPLQGFQETGFLPVAVPL